MFLYKFMMEHDDYEIRKRILNNTTPYQLTKMGYTGSYMSNVRGNSVIIVKTPVYKKAIVASFFCGRLLKRNNNCYLYGIFMYPLRMLLPQIIFFFTFVTIFSIIQKSIFILTASVIAYLFMMFFCIMMLNINTKAKKEILDFIQNTLDGEICR